jgi:hypothetical protein
MIKQENYLSSKTTFLFSGLIALAVVLIVWLSGLKSHRDIIQNALLSTTIVFILLSIFLSSCLYFGLKLKYKEKNFFDQLKSAKYPNLGNGDFFSFFEGGDGIISSILIGLVIGLVLVFLTWMFGMVLWGFLIGLFAFLHWVFYRSIRIVLKNVSRCKKNVFKSILLGFFYSVIFSSLAYLLLFLLNYLHTK